MENILVFAYLSLFVPLYFLNPFYPVYYILLSYCWLPAILGFQETGAGFTFMGIRVGMVAILFLLSRIFNERKDYNRTVTANIYKFMLIAGIITLLHILISGVWIKNIQFLLKILSPMFLFVYVYTLENRYANRSTFDKVIMISFVLGFLAFIYQDIVGANVTIVDTFGIERRLSIFGEPNSTALFFIIGIIFIRKDVLNRGFTWLKIVILICLYYAVLLTLSRIGIILGSIFLITMIYSGKRGIFWILTIMIIILYFVYLKDADLLKQILAKQILARFILRLQITDLQPLTIFKALGDSSIIDAYTLGRYTIWQDNISYIFSSATSFFLGSGFHNTEIRVSHNDYLYIASRLGIISLIFYIKYLVSLLLEIRFFKYNQMRYKTLSICNSITLVFVLWAMFDNFVYKHDIISYIAIINGFYMADALKIESTKD